MMKNMAALEFTESAEDGLLQLLPWASSRPAPVVREDDPVMVAAMLMAFRGVDFIPVIRSGGILAGAVGGSEIIRLLRESMRDGFGALIRNKTGSIAKEIGRATSKATIPEILNIMRSTSFGNVCVVKGNNLITTITIRDLIGYASTISDESGLRVSEVASKPVVSLEPDATVSDLLNMMITRRIRRVVIDVGGRYLIADDRALIQTAFSPTGTMMLRDFPESFFNMKLSKLPLTEPGTIDGDKDMTVAWREMYTNQSCCLLVDDGWGILTPWDSVIKPYLRGCFPTRESP